MGPLLDVALVLAVMMALAMPTPVLAADAGQAHYRAGMEQASRGDLRTAGALFEQAYAAAPRWRYAFNASRAAALVHDLTRAELWIWRAGGIASTAGERQKTESERVVIERQLQGAAYGRLLIRVETVRPGTLVQADGEFVQARDTNWVAWVRAGRRTLRADTPGCAGTEQTAAVSAGERITVLLQPCAPPQAEVTPAARSPAEVTPVAKPPTEVTPVAAPPAEVTPAVAPPAEATPISQPSPAPAAGTPGTAAAPLPSSPGRPAVVLREAHAAPSRVVSIVLGGGGLAALVIGAAEMGLSAQVSVQLNEDYRRGALTQVDYRGQRSALATRYFRGCAALGLGMAGVAVAAWLWPQREPTHLSVTPSGLDVAWRF